MGNINGSRIVGAYGKKWKYIVNQKNILVN